MEVSGLSSSDGGIGKTTVEMQKADTFTEEGWGNTPVWIFDEGNDYPRLWWEDEPDQFIQAGLYDFLEGEGTEENPYVIYTLEDIIPVSIEFIRFKLRRGENFL